MDRHVLIAAEYGFEVSDNTPIYRFQQLSEFAMKRRNDRIEAAQNGNIFVG
ncbi:hypothetical protein [Ralstonia phage phiRSL1]|uniref:Uncharacterized protein n=1 Tax=Ralstonia phage phiRSL1 TaxID=1980924 RepID=B2ZYI7_9CAUD|nr:hypothetical protein RSL1_ORF206 [Ralstonia phage phiRSL1]BAG41655.1 hypothetical protein [Ralstonia phage phiRSL1]